MKKFILLISMICAMVCAMPQVEANYDIEQLKRPHSTIFYFYKKNVNLDIEQQMQRARTLILDEQDVNLGISVLDEILKHEKDAESYLLRGLAYTKLKKYSEADKNYEQALLMEPENPTFYYFRGLNTFYRGLNEKNTYNKVSFFNTAIYTFEKALKYEEYYIDAIVSIGDVYNAYGEFYYKGNEYNKINKSKNSYENAIKQYNKVIVLFPNNAVVLAKKEDAQSGIKACEDYAAEQKRKEEERIRKQEIKRKVNN